MSAAESGTARAVAVNKGIYPTEAEALRGVVDRLVSALDPAAIWLFGSRAHGDGGPDSDFDLMVVAKPGAPWGSEDYVTVLRPLRDTGVGCDIVPSSAEDFAEAAKLRTTLVAEVIRNGRKLYEAAADRRVPEHCA